MHPTMRAQCSGAVAELKAAVRQSIASGILPRIEDTEGSPSVIAVGRQAS